MHQKRATQSRNLFPTIEHETAGNSTKQAEMLSRRDPRCIDTVSRRIIDKYIPLYHIELVRERMIPIEPRPAIHNSDDVAAILEEELLKADREKLVCVMLSAKNVVIGMDIVSIGTLTSSLASGREIFKAAILLNAAAIILSHNHPSGDAAPSREDIQLTDRISKAGEILGIRLLDHVIIAAQGNYSFSNAGRLP